MPIPPPPLAKANNQIPRPCANPPTPCPTNNHVFKTCGLNKSVHWAHCSECEALAEKMSIIPAIVVRADWMFAQSLERLKISGNPRNIRWAEGDIICRIAKRKDTWEWRELKCLGLAVLSLTNVLRIGEAWTVSSPRDGKLCFMGEKSQSGDHDQDLGPWPSRWMRFIKEELHNRGVAEDRPHGYQSPADLEEVWVALVAGLELAHYRWHCLWRGGAT